MLTNLNQLSLGIFFLYFVLISGSCSKLLNCGLQRYIENSVALKHVLIFLSIYIFTFILNWYTVDSLVVEKFDNPDEDKVIDIINVSASFSYLQNAFFYSIFIYAIFILSTKTEGGYLVMFLLLSVLLVFVQIIMKALYGDSSNVVNSNLYESKSTIKKQLKEDDLPYDENLVNVSRVIPAAYVVLGAILFRGVGKYFTRQRSEHSKNWDTITFFFGNNHCQGV